MFGRTTSARRPGEKGYSLSRALVAGLGGGLVGTAVKTICELISPPRPPGQPSPLGRGIAIMFSASTGHEISDSYLYIFEMILHWVFGTAAGIAYSLLAEKTQLATVGYGLGFGIIFWLLLHELFLPLIRWSAWPAGMSLHEQGNEFISHCFYGVAVELTRRTVRNRIEPQ